MHRLMIQRLSGRLSRLPFFAYVDGRQQQAQGEDDPGLDIQGDEGYEEDGQERECHEEGGLGADVVYHGRWHDVEVVHLGG